MVADAGAFTTTSDLAVRRGEFMGSILYTPQRRETELRTPASRTDKIPIAPDAIYLQVPNPGFPAA